MKQANPAPVKGQRLNLNLGGSDFNRAQTNSKTKDRNHHEILDELARKWVRFGCADTPNEAMKMLIGGLSK